MDPMDVHVWWLLKIRLFTAQAGLKRLMILQENPLSDVFFLKLAVVMGGGRFRSMAITQFFDFSGDFIGDKYSVVKFVFG